MWAGHKLSQKNAQKIEEHTGKSPDDLSDEEVEAAMEELGIEEEELTEEDIHRIVVCFADSAERAVQAGFQVLDHEHLIPLPDRQAVFL